MKYFGLVMSLIWLGACESMTAPPEDQLPRNRCPCCIKPGMPIPGYGDLPKPPITLFEQLTPAEAEARGGRGFTRARGVMDIELSMTSPVHIIWNNERKTKPWGEITLREIREDCLVTINFGSDTISAKPGEVFPSTGIMVVSANRRTGYVWLRSRFTKTVMMDERLEMLEESLKAMRQLRGNRVAAGDDEGMKRLDKAIAEQQVEIGAERHMRNLRWELESLHDARNSALDGGDRKKRLTQQIDALTSEIEALER